MDLNTFLLITKRFLSIAGLNPHSSCYHLLHSCFLISINAIPLLFHESFFKSIDLSYRSNSPLFQRFAYSYIFLACCICSVTLIVYSLVKTKQQIKLENLLFHLCNTTKTTKLKASKSFIFYFLLLLFKIVDLFLSLFFHSYSNFLVTQDYGTLFFGLLIQISLFVILASQNEFLSCLIMIVNIFDHLDDSSIHISCKIKLFNNVTDYCYELENSYSFRNLIHLLYGSVSLPSTLVFMIQKVFNKISEAPLFRSIHWCFTILIYIFELVIMTSRVHSKAKKFTNSLYNLMMEDKLNDLANNENLHLHLIMKREVKFTACGFFPLDFTLIHSMIATATTYLIILMQFGHEY